MCPTPHIPQTKHKCGPVTNKPQLLQFAALSHPSCGQIKESPHWAYIGQNLQAGVGLLQVTEMMIVTIGDFATSELW